MVTLNFLNKVSRKLLIFFAVNDMRQNYLYWLVLGRDDRLRCDKLLLQEFRLCSASGWPITSSPITTGFGFDFNRDLLLMDSLLFFTCSRLTTSSTNKYLGHFTKN